MDVVSISGNPDQKEHSFKTLAFLVINTKCKSLRWHWFYRNILSLHSAHCSLLFSNWYCAVPASDLGLMPMPLISCSSCGELQLTWTLSPYTYMKLGLFLSPFSITTVRFSRDTKSPGQGSGLFILTYLCKVLETSGGDSQ